MLVALSFLSLLASLFLFLMALLGASREPLLWQMALVMFLFGLIGPATVGHERLRENKRREAIRARAGEWGSQTCEALVAKRIGIDMTQEMVLLAWGTPDYVDEKETTKKSARERWVYGRPRRGARYIWFADGKVSKTKA